VRKAIALGKETAEEYLDVHRAWHRLGGRSTCTMLYGHVESLADRIDHLQRLRDLQDETHGFVGFIPLPYQPANNPIPVKHPPTAFDTLRTFAVSRLFLDNIHHITAYWVGLGLRVAQLALLYGADDLHGTIQEEQIFHMAGAASPQALDATTLVQAIHEAGFTAVQRNTFYEPIRIVEPPAAAPLPETPVPPHVLQQNLAT
jgi:aminodeoxyfutalosine synthase